jgi:hypothetical protein
MSADDLLGPVRGIDDIKLLSQKLRRPIATLLALTVDADPFYANMPSRRRGAEWFADLWSRYEFDQYGVLHVRRVHYVLISKGEVKHCNGADYVNTERHWWDLVRSCRDARLLGLIPFEKIEDHRAEHAIEHLVTAQCDAALGVEDAVEMPERFPLQLISANLYGPPDYVFEPARPRFVFCSGGDRCHEDYLMPANVSLADTRSGRQRIMPPAAAHNVGAGCTTGAAVRN